MIEIIKNAPVFKGIGRSEMEIIIKNTNHQIKAFRAGKMIFQSGDKCSDFLTLVEGSVKGEMSDISGKLIKIEDVTAPNHIAAAFVFGNNRFPVNVIATTDVSILFITSQSFIKILQANQTLLKNYLDIVSNTAQFLTNKIRFLSFKTIKSKMANMLLELSDQQNSRTIVLPQNKKNLAEHFGVARPSISRIVSELEKDEIIMVKGKNIKIINHEGLKKCI